MNNVYLPQRQPRLFMMHLLEKGITAVLPKLFRTLLSVHQFCEMAASPVLPLNPKNTPLYPWRTVLYHSHKLRNLS
jgi:hypothetical protein